MLLWHCHYLTDVPPFYVFVLNQERGVCSGCDAILDSENDSAACFFSLYWLADLGSFAGLGHRLQPRYAILFRFAGLLIVAGNAWRWREMLSRDLWYPAAFSAVIIGSAGNVVLPARGGMCCDSMLRRAGA